MNGAKVLITGGLGFIGSNLAIRLVELGAKVTLVDSLIPEYGGNLFNIEPVQQQVQAQQRNWCSGSRSPRLSARPRLPGARSGVAG